MLDVIDVKKAYGQQPVLRGINLRIDGGEIVALLGANGAGKTTLISIVAGLTSADGGRVLIAGTDPADRPAIRHLVGVAPQSLGLYPTLSVRANLEFFAQLAGTPRRRTASEVNSIAHALDLHDHLDHRAGILSGGQQRRLHTAMALVGRPRLLFLDEPTVGADIESRGYILEVVADLAAEGCAVCYTTQHLAEVADLGATLAILSGGRIVARGSSADLTAERPGIAPGDVEALYRHLTGHPGNTAAGGKVAADHDR